MYLLLKYSSENISSMTDWNDCKPRQSPLKLTKDSKVQRRMAVSSLKAGDLNPQTLFFRMYPGLYNLQNWSELWSQLFQRHWLVCSNQSHLPALTGVDPSTDKTVRMPTNPNANQHSTVTQGCSSGIHTSMKIHSYSLSTATLTSLLKIIQGFLILWTLLL